MANCELVELDPLEIEAYQSKEVLKVLLHSIIFQRALGECRLRECESDLFDLSYVRCDSRTVCRRVDAYAEAFSSALERSASGPSAGSKAGQALSGSSSSSAPAAPTTHVPAKICVSFVEKRSRPGTFGLFRGEDKVIWERWNIALSVRSVASAVGPTGGGEGDARRRQQQQHLAEELRARLEMILTTASSRKEHIPPADGLGGGDGTWFEVTSDSESWGGGFGDLFKFARRLGDTIATT
jgi:autophagy-related protein 101